MIGHTISKRVKNNSPCYKCDRRHTGCHGECEDYQTWLAPLVKAREERVKRQGAESVKSDAITKALKRRRQKNGQS